MAGETAIHPIEPDHIKKELKQGVPIYLLYSLLFVNIYNCRNDGCDVTTIPLGLGIAGFNIIMAGKNKPWGMRHCH